MSRTVMSHCLIKFLKDEEKAFLSTTNDSNREELMMIYNQTKITSEDMLREYTLAEVQELCERTKVKVKMYKLNSVWDAKRRFEQKKRLENKSAHWVNKMLVKADSRRMVERYSELDMAKYKELAACVTKKDNNVRLDRWHRQRRRAANIPEPPVILSSDSEAEREERPEQPKRPSLSPNMSPLRVEPSPGASEDVSDESSLPDLDCDPILWGIGDEDEAEEIAEAVGNGPPGGVAETQLNSSNWEHAGQDINSESLSVLTLLNTQNTERDH